MKKRLILKSRCDEEWFAEDEFFEYDYAFQTRCLAFRRKGDIFAFYAKLEG